MTVLFLVVVSLHVVVVPSNKELLREKYHPRLEREPAHAQHTKLTAVLQVPLIIILSESFGFDIVWFCFIFYFLFFFSSKYKMIST